MKAVGFLMDFAGDLIDCTAYLPLPMYSKLQDLYEHLGENVIELEWELENKDLRDVMYSYAAMCICMANAKHSVSKYTWDNCASIESIDFDPPIHHFDADLYIKGLFYSQWRIEEYILSKIVEDNPDRRKSILRATKRHNERYKKTYGVWLKSMSQDEYITEQYIKRIDENIRQKKKATTLDNLEREIKRLGLPDRYTNVLMLKLNDAYERKKPKVVHEVYHEPKSKSIHPIYNHNGSRR